MSFIREEKSIRLGCAGNLGSGKTILITAFGLEDYENGEKVYANYTTDFAEELSVREMYKIGLKNCSVCLDEVETIIDSGMSGSRSPFQRFVTYFFLQTRKLDVKVYYTSQLLGMVDLRLRYITDRKYVAERFSDHFLYTLFFDIHPIKRYKLMHDDIRLKKIIDSFESREVIYPIDLLTEEKLNFSGKGGIVSVFNKAPTKKAFIMSVKKQLQFTSLDTISAVYDYLNADLPDEAKDLLIS